jgi:NADPH-dependent 2,4-dienoyl-CoA reductase/sulfur reductase-like enzyme
MMASYLLDGTSQVNSRSALVIGGGLVGLETADYLSKQGHKIILVEMLPEIGADMDPLAKSMLLGRLNQQNVEIHKNSRVIKLTENEVFVKQGEDTVQFPIETVVMAVGVRANRELVDSLENSG